MRKLYNHKLIAHLHYTHGGKWKRIHRDYLIMTNCNTELRQLRDAHHYWRGSNRVIKPKNRTIKYDQQLIKRLIEFYKLNWTVIYREYCLMTNTNVNKDNFICACKYYLRK